MFNFLYMHDRKNYTYTCAFIFYIKYYRVIITIALYHHIMYDVYYIAR